MLCSVYVYAGGVLGKSPPAQRFGLMISALTPHFIPLPIQTYPDLQPLYDAARSYLEIPQRLNLLNTRVAVGSAHTTRDQDPLIDIGRALNLPGSAGHAPAAERDRVQPSRRTPRDYCNLAYRRGDW